MKRTQEEILNLYDKYYDMVWRICLMQLGNMQDAYDGTQETFIRLMNCSKVFQDEEHAKAWLIRTAANYCKDILKSSWRKKQICADWTEVMEGALVPDAYNEVFEAMMELPKKYRIIIYLHYYEGYSLKEVADIIKVNASTVRSRLAKAKSLMRGYLEEV